jgi:hypothetical protein
MPEVLIKSRLEPQMVICMHHLVRYDIFHHTLALDPVRADFDSVLVVKPGQHAFLARFAPNVVFPEIPAQFTDVVIHVSYNRRRAEEVVAPGFAALTIELRVPLIRIVPVCFLTLGRHRACGHAVEVFEAVDKGGAGEEFEARLGGRGRGGG